MKEFITMVLGAGSLIWLFCLLFLIGPVLLLWSINSLAELGGSKFYIDHSLWSYWVAVIFLILVRGGSTSN